jgi:hypothetical protein
MIFEAKNPLKIIGGELLKKNLLLSIINVHYLFLTELLRVRVSITF